jgi:hypothetical protein
MPLLFIVSMHPEEREGACTLFPPSSNIIFLDAWATISAVESVDLYAEHHAISTSGLFLNMGASSTM